MKRFICLILMAVVLCINARAEGAENSKNVGKSETTRDVRKKALHDGLTYQGTIDRIIQLLDKESINESIKRLAETHLYQLPGVLAVGSETESEYGDVIRIIGNRRFLKILHELSLLPRSEAGNILNKDIDNTLKKYNTQLDKFLNTYSGTFKHNRNTQRIKDKKLIAFITYDPKAKGPILAGLRYKLLTLALIAGNLNLDSMQSSIDKISQTAIDQRNRFSTEELFTKFDGMNLIAETSLYNRRILGIAVLGTFVNSDKERGQVLKSLNLDVKTKQMTPYNSKVTPLDSSHTHNFVPVDFSNGELSVMYFDKLTDLDFERLINTLNN